MSPLAHPLVVPLQADSVLSPRLVYGHVSPLAAADDDDRDCDAVYFPLPHNAGPGEGRVTFEGLDAVRACPGEYVPYELAVPFTRGDWVYEISDSSWLSERHAYESRHYDTPLIGTHRHYLFVFHDEYVEAIAQGIWFDEPDAADPRSLPRDHPLARLDGLVSAEPRTSPSGIAWELRRSPKSREAVLQDSELCSQRLYQFNLVLDGRSRESASVWLRTIDGHATSLLKRDWVGGVASVDGIAEPEDFFDAWERYVADVAGRRRAMGKSMA